ncbi:MAG: hypothetical protein KY393_00430 [Actinobacteria bacterium]|nr:hypothetical protein [Actinomycetota bacterium]
MSEDAGSPPENRSGSAESKPAVELKPATARTEGGTRLVLEQLGSRLADAARAHPNRTVFIVGALLFASGLVGVVGSQVGSDVVSELISDLDPTPSASPAAASVGPALGEPVEPYISSRRTLVAERAESDPGISTLALVVFNSYKTADEVQQFLSARSLSGLAAQTRVPTEGVEPAHVPLVGRSLDQAAVWQAEAIQQRLDALNEIAAVVDGDEYRAIYGRQLERYREAKGLLEQPAPATIFAVAIHATYETLSRAADAPEVRYIDVPVDPTVALQETSFAATVPEDVDRMTLRP